MIDYYTTDNVGTAKYTVSTHDGKTRHSDGSKFYNIKLFKNKKKYNAHLLELDNLIAQENQNQLDGARRYHKTSQNLKCQRLD